MILAHSCAIPYLAQKTGRILAPSRPMSWNCGNGKTWEIASLKLWINVCENVSKYKTIVSSTVSNKHQANSHVFNAKCWPKASWNLSFCSVDPCAIHFKTCQDLFCHGTTTSPHMMVNRFQNCRFLGLEILTIFLRYAGNCMWRFPKIEVPQNGWFTRENPNLKWMMQGYPHKFLETPLALRFPPHSRRFCLARITSKTRTANVGTMAP